MKLAVSEAGGNTQCMGDNAYGRRQNPQLAVVFLHPVAGQGSKSDGREVYTQLSPGRRRHQRICFNAVMIGEAMLGHLHVEDGHAQVQSIENEESSTGGSGKPGFRRHEDKSRR